MKNKQKKEKKVCNKLIEKQWVNSSQHLTLSWGKNVDDNTIKTIYCWKGKIELMNIPYNNINKDNNVVHLEMNTQKVHESICNGM